MAKPDLPGMVADSRRSAAVVRYLRRLIHAVQHARVQGHPLAAFAGQP